MDALTIDGTGGALARARLVISLFKLRIGVLIMITALVGFAVTPGAAADAGTLLALALSVLAASASAGAFNQYVDFASDRLMRRTRGRAFACGALQPHAGWLLVMALLLAGGVLLAWAAINAMAAVHVFLGAFFYGVVYTLWLKRRTHWNIVIGGLAGSFAVLAGGAAADPTLPPMAWAFAAILFFWTPPHFWSLAIAHRADYEAAGVPMLPVVAGDARAAQIVLASTVALVVSSAVPLGFGLGWIYALGVVAAGAFFIGRAWRLARAPSRATAMGCFLASLVHLSALLACALLDAGLR
ncbi:heme o synthase [Ramlibacter sp.]|uniref:heme o synthase n=1 Tax=Ramlibacter sp. TaxID=1917967 RepID=UPI0035AF7413